MRKVINFLTKAVYVIAGIILLYLSYNSMHYTFMPMFRSGSSDVCEGPDSRLRSLIFVLLAFLCVFLISKLLFIGTRTKKQRANRVKGFLVLDIVLTAAFLFMYVKNTHIAPYWDQAQVLNDAKAFLAGDFSDMANTYLHKFPQQLGLIFWEIPFLFIWNDFMVFQYLNAIFILLTIYVSYLLVRELFADELVEFLTIVAVTLFLPIHVYVNFIYGDLPSIMGCLFIALMLAKWCKTDKGNYLVVAIIASCVFTLVRENVLIFLIASAITITLTAIKKRRYMAILAAFCIIILPILSSKGVLKLFEYKSGEIIDNPIPSVSWIAMGLQGDPETSTGVGYYNGYNEATWWYQGATTQAASDFVTAEMKERIDYMASNPSFAYKFFRYKVLEQWIEPSFDSLYMTITNYEEAGKWAVDFYSGDYPEKMLSFMNVYLTLAYFYAFIYMIYAFKKEVTPEKLVLVIAFIGGFLFSILWEAKGRYAMPYFVFMIPISVTGLGMSVNIVDKWIRKNIFKRGVDK